MSDTRTLGLPGNVEIDMILDDVSEFMGLGGVRVGGVALRSASTPIRLRCDTPDGILYTRLLLDAVHAEADGSTRIELKAVGLPWARGEYCDEYNQPLTFPTLSPAKVEDRIALILRPSTLELGGRTWTGFSYAVDAPLDMRMDPRGGQTAADLLAELSERELSDLFSRYGEERYSRQIARAICRRRTAQPYERSADLVDTIRHAIPTPAQFGSGHPAKRVFQALRIAVNDELTMVEEGLEAAMQILKPGGRIAVISFHSLEDRIVKDFFRAAAAPCICPPDLPICGCDRQATLRVLTPRVIRPGAAEVDRNPRAASSRLRVAERTDAPLPKDAA